jgi:hypothetical protein
MEITPFCSVGVLAFGDIRKDARAKLNAKFSTFLKDMGENETDSFDDIGLHLYYDSEGRLEFVEGFEPVDITFRSISFVGRDVASIIRDMSAIGVSEIYSDAGVRFPAAGIALYAPSGVVEGVAAHRKGYYD